MKKLISFILCFLMVFSSTTTVYAKNQQFEKNTIEFSIDELNDDVEIPLYLEDGKITSRSSNTARSVEIGTFSVKLERRDSKVGYLRWTLNLVVGSGILSKVLGKMYCKSTSPISKKVYCNEIISASRLSGTHASGSSSPFNLPAKGTKVVVGWKDVIIYTIDDSISIANNRSIVTI